MFIQIQLIFKLAYNTDVVMIRGISKKNVERKCAQTIARYEAMGYTLISKV